MKRTLIIAPLFSILFCCFNKSNSNSDISKSSVDVADKKQYVTHLGDTLKGDYLLYSGAVMIKNESGIEQLDSTVLMELVFDRDNRFAVRHRFLEKQFRTDTAEWRMEGGFSNKGFGRWNDVEGKVEMTFHEGSVDFFDWDKNTGVLEIVNNRTALLEKGTKKVWIWRTECSEKTDR